MQAMIGRATALCVIWGAASAQEPLPVPVAETALEEAVVAEGEPPADVAPPAEPDPDAMAADLNARQQIKQTFTFTRTIDGEVVDTESRTVTYKPGDPLRPTEAGTSVIQELASAFNNEVLTRTEAFEEAKLDFVVGDLDRDSAMTADEFAGLVDTWRATARRDAPAGDEETARERQYRAFVDGIDPAAAKAESDNRAKRKFAYMTGAATTLSREDYIREYLLDFDSMDGNGDTLLKGDELLMFRALNKGETLAE